MTIKSKRFYLHKILQTYSALEHWYFSISLSYMTGADRY